MGSDAEQQPSARDDKPSGNVSDELSDKLSDELSDKLSSCDSTAATSTQSRGASWFGIVLGGWRDSQGSNYVVTLDDRGAQSSACSVQTTRPGGAVRTTNGLIRCGWVKGYDVKRVTWDGQYVGLGLRY